jgi:hypothetical protein
MWDGCLNPFPAPEHQLLDAASGKKVRRRGIQKHYSDELADEV